jgi:hypothetical protein
MVETGSAPIDRNFDLYTMQAGWYYREVSFAIGRQTHFVAEIVNQLIESQGDLEQKSTSHY